MGVIKIYIAFSKVSYSKATITDKLVAKWTHGNYFHTELIIPYGNNLNIFKMYSSTPDTGCVRVAPHVWNDDKYDYVPFLIDREKLNIMLDFFDTIMGAKYDRLGILGFILPTQDRSDMWFCSESVSNAFKITGFKPMWFIEPSSMSPNSFYDMLIKYNNSL